MLWNKCLIKNLVENDYLKLNLIRSIISFMGKRTQFEKSSATVNLEKQQTLSDHS